MDGEAMPETPALERFHFDDAGHVTPEQLRILRSMDELLARNLTHTLSAWMRTGITVTAEAQTQQQFREFVDGSDECYTLPVQLPDMHATGLLRWPLPLATHMIELLLGGSGAGPSPARELTEIEDDIFMAVLQVVLREWNTVWERIALRLEPGERSRNGGERQLMTPVEKVFCFRLGVVVGEVTGEVSLCVAAPVLASVLRRVHLLQRSSRNRTDGDMDALLQALNKARVRAGLCFAPVRMSASKLATLRPGGTLVLPLPSNATAEFRISEVPVASAMPIRVGEWRAARITALREAPTGPALPSARPMPARAEEGATHG